MLDMKECYKVWMTIEKKTINENGEEVYEDLKEETSSAGNFDTHAEAILRMEEIELIYCGDFRSEENKI